MLLVLDIGFVGCWHKKPIKNYSHWGFQFALSKGQFLVQPKFKKVMKQNVDDNITSIDGKIKF